MMAIQFQKQLSTQHHIYVSDPTQHTFLSLAAHRMRQMPGSMPYRNASLHTLAIRNSLVLPSASRTRGTTIVWFSIGLSLGLAIFIRGCFPTLLIFFPCLMNSNIQSFMWIACCLFRTSEPHPVIFPCFFPTILFVFMPVIGNNPSVESALLIKIICTVFTSYWEVKIKGTWTHKASPHKPGYPRS